MGIGSMNSRLIPLHIGGAGAGGSSATNGTVTPTFTGFSADPAFDLRYRIVGGIVTLSTVSGGTMTGTSNSSGFTVVTGLPAAACPAVTLRFITTVVDNGTVYLAAVSVATNGTLTFSLGQVSGALTTFSPTAFTSSGSKGIQSTFTMTYPAA
jgi:hypothetical protein